MAGLSSGLFKSNIANYYEGRSVDSISSSLWGYSTKYNMPNLSQEYYKLEKDISSLFVQIDKSWADYNGSLLRSSTWGQRVLASGSILDNVALYQKFQSDSYSYSGGRKAFLNKNKPANLLTMDAFLTAYENNGIKNGFMQIQEMRSGKTGVLAPQFSGADNRFNSFMQANPKLFRDFSNTYNALKNNMIQGYENNLKLGQKMRGTKDFGYFLPLLEKKNTVLSKAYTLTETGMSKLLKDPTTTRLNFQFNQKGIFSVALGLSKTFESQKSVKAYFEQFEKNNSEDIIDGVMRVQNGQRYHVSSDRLRKEYNIIYKAYKQGLIIKPSGEYYTSKKTDIIKGNRLSEILTDNEAISAIKQLLQGKISGGYQKHADQIASVANSDSSFSGHELSTKTLPNTLRLMSGTNLKSLYQVFGKKENIRNEVKSIIQGNYKIEKDRSGYLSKDAFIAKKMFYDEQQLLMELETSLGKIGGFESEYKEIQSLRKAGNKLTQKDDGEFLLGYEEWKENW